MIAYFKLVKVDKLNGCKTHLVNCFICETPIEVINKGDEFKPDDIVCCSCIDYAKDHYSW